MPEKETVELLRRVEAAVEYAKVSPVKVYASGLFHCSACAPVDFTPDVVEREVNLVRVAGTEQGWKVSSERFSTGEPNPCPCNHAPDRQHWLMVC
jgi:hypothetical protein